MLGKQFIGNIKLIFLFKCYYIMRIEYCNSFYKLKLTFTQWITTLLIQINSIRIRLVQLNTSFIYLNIVDFLTPLEIIHLTLQTSH